MDITAENLSALFNTYNTAFSAGMQRGPDIPAELATEYLKFAELAMAVPSTGESTIHAWLNQIPGFREWVGDRQKKAIGDGALTVINADFEDTVAVPRNKILDDQYGLFTPLMTSMGIEGGDETLWLERAIDAMLANGKWADGTAFFAAARKYGKSTIKNYVTDALSDTSLAAAIATMMSYNGPEGLPLKVAPVYLVVGPNQRDNAWSLVKNSLKVAKAVSGDTAGAAIENPLKGRALLRVHPRITGNQWFLLGTKSGIKPVAVQKRQEAKLTALANPTDPNVFFNKEFIYGADARGEAFLTLPHLAYGGFAT